MGNQYDYRQLREFINANHDRFSELNFDSSMSMQQKMNGLVEWFKVMLKEYNDWVEYLDDFKENFDEKLYTTTDEILAKWLDDGVLSELIRATTNEEVIDSRTNKKTNKKYTKLVDRLDTENDELVTKTTSNKQMIDNLRSDLKGKVDKNGNEQISMGMLSQPVKEAITGGSVAVVGVDAVNTTNIVDGAVTDIKVSSPVLKASILIGYTPPNFDRATKTFIFNGVTGAQDIVVFGSKSYLVPVGTKVVNDITGTSAFKLVFDTVTNTFKFISWTTAPSKTEVVIMSYRVNPTNDYLITADFPINVDGYPSTRYSPKLPVVTILGGGSASNNLPKISTSNKTLVFPNGHDWIFTINGTQYTSAIPSTGLTIDLSILSGTSAFYILYNITNKEIFFATWTDVNKYVNGHAILGTIRVLGSTYSVYLPFPYLLDGKLYGYAEGSESFISVSLQAPVKCIHHRGYSRKYPENTAIAYKGSKKIGVNEIEMDLAFTSDNIPVNLHDTSINRTARNQDGTIISETKNIADITFAEASQYEYGSWKSPEYKGEKLMTFEDVVLLCKKLDMRLHLDRASAYFADKLTIVKDILDKHKFTNVLFYGYDFGGVDRLRTIFPESEIVYLVSGSDITQEVVDQCAARNAEYFCGIIAYAPLLTESGTKLALDKDVEVYVWGGDIVDRSLMVDWGVTGISTDFANIQQELVNI